MATDKDREQDRMIRENGARISRNEEAIRRQTAALEQIRDHYYPPPARPWRKMFALLAKVCCAGFAYLGIAQTVDWLWNVRKADALAERYAAVGRRLLLEEGDAAGAIACYSKARELDRKKPDYGMTLDFLKGMALTAALFNAGRPLTDDEEAQVDAALAEAVVQRDLDPRNPMPHVLMAQSFALSGEKDEAVEEIGRAIACDPENASVRVSACAINFFAGNPAEARNRLAEAERLDASLPLVAVWKGLLALQADRDAAAAVKHFRSVTQRMPRLASAHAMLGKSLLALDKPDLAEVRASFDRALVLNARLLSAMLGMAETYEREGNLVLAGLWLDRTLAIDGRCQSALVARARVSVRLGKSTEAVRDLTAAIALTPFRGDLYRLRAEIFEKSGETAQARSDLLTADALEKIDK